MNPIDRSDDTVTAGDDATALHQEHLRQLGMMLVGIAHELNTPLGVVASTCDSLQRCQEKLREVLAQPSLTAADHERLRDILAHMDSGKPVLTAGIGRMQGLVRELRLAGREDRAARHEPMSLVDILEGNLVLLHFDLKQGISIERHYEIEPLVPAHPVFLAQVFLNLLRNAIQAMDGQGTIVLTIRDSGDQVVVEVADTGPGLTDDLLARLFQEPLTTKCEDTGTGIGLLNCRRIVEKHGGTIAAGNRPTGGAVFTVTLPQA